MFAKKTGSTIDRRETLPSTTMGFYCKKRNIKDRYGKGRNSFTKRGTPPRTKVKKKKIKSERISPSLMDNETNTPNRPQAREANSTKLVNVTAKRQLPTGCRRPAPSHHIRPILKSHRFYFYTQKYPPYTDQHIHTSPSAMVERSTYKQPTKKPSSIPSSIPKANTNDQTSQNPKVEQDQSSILTRILLATVGSYFYLPF